MAINQRGSRRIVVGAVAYRWTVRPKPSYCQANGWSNLTFAVELEAARGSVLLVTMDGPRPDNWFPRYGQRTIVTPSLIGRAIQAGIAEGWRSKLKGTPHRLRLGADQQFRREESPAECAQLRTPSSSVKSPFI